ncbi:nucleotidyltransferase substrate binding protein [Desulfobacter sp.]|uniref:nucleotidyltransferase substrate binding protein n=1 Tax=Desulfobacter sp. TaxID=2294 RepID=UPI000E86980C|nr:nucleotidyltransferase substrate binding protein [Desulfobacter sp.]HBT88879.1 hypothetical protein [Desulfobacter sp.]
MKDYFQYQGNTHITGSRDATRESFQNQLITDGENWMGMITTRDRAGYTYDDAMVDRIILKVAEVYYNLFIAFEKVMEKLDHRK